MRKPARLRFAMVKCKRNIVFAVSTVLVPLLANILISESALAQSKQASVESLMRQAEAFSEQDESENALDVYGRVLALDPKYSRAYYLRALLLWSKGSRDAAARDLEKCMKLEPGEQPARFLTTIYLEQKKYKEGLVAATNLIKIKDGDRNHALLIEMLIGLKRYQEAIDQSTICIKRNRKPDALLRARSICYFETKQYDKALADCNRLISLKPNLMKSYELRAKIYQAKGLKELAAKDLKHKTDDGDDVYDVAPFRGRDRSLDGGKQ